MNEQKPKFKYSYLVVLLLLVLVVVLIFTNNGYKGEYIDGGLNEVQELIDGRVTEEGVTEKIVEARYKNGTIYFLLKDSKYKENFPKYSDYYLYYESGDGVLEAVLKKLNDSDIKYQKISESRDWWSIVYPVLYICFGLFLVFMIYKLLGSQGKGAMGFGKSKVKPHTTSKVRFSDIAGTEEEKEELKEIVEFLKAPKRFTDLGARIPKGVLLVGHPGTGKTLLARAVAGEANVPFISISGSDFVEMFVGVGASRVRDLFEQAKKNKPCIVFIDEIDAVGRQRGAGLGGGNDEREQTLNQLLVEMDGFEPNEGIIVLAATNRSDVLDPALMRPGRFDRQVYVNIPDVKGREGILKIHARNKPLDENVDFATLAKITVGFTGADIENMLNEAAILAARAGRPKIVMADITEGINKVMMGPQKKSRLVTEKDKKITAYHEAGHALLAQKLEHTDQVQEVSIIPRGMAGGYTMQRPENDNAHKTYNQLMDDIAVFMGGRLAEEIVYKDITTGASSDISQATKLARNMVYSWGMSKNLGFLALDSNETLFIGRDYQTKNDFSEKLAAEADDEVRGILDYNYKRGKKILTENIELLHEMASLLLEQETINKDEIDMLLEGKKTAEIVEIMKQRAEEQKAKEEKYRKEQQLVQRKKFLENKIAEGEKLVANGIITKEDLEGIKKSYQEVVDQLEGKVTEEKPVTVTIKQGIELPKVEEKTEEKNEKDQNTVSENVENEKVEENVVDEKPKANTRSKKGENKEDK